MANISNTMVITNDALSQISRRLIEKMTYNPNLITPIGKVKTLNSIGYDFSKTSYFIKSGLSLSDTYEKTTIEFKGTMGFAEAGTEDFPNPEIYCAFKMGEISLWFNKNICRVARGVTSAVQVINLGLKEDDEVTVAITYTPTEVSLKLFVNGTDKVYEASEVLLSPQAMSSITNIYLGTNAPNSNNYWRGKIDLNNFEISQDGNTIYSTANRPTIKFTEILICDKEHTLTDGSTPITGHILSFPVTEISKTNNNILITATVDAETYIFINEIGLYCTFEDGSTHLFSKLSNVKLEKTTDIGYNIIIHLNLNINVVNTVLFPEIITKQADYPKLSDFETIQQVYTYATENLERMIKTNALGIGNYTNTTMTDIKPVGIGYNKAQVYCRRSDELDIIKDNFNATFAYSCLSDWIQARATIHHIFTDGYVTTYGQVNIEGNGQATVEPKLLVSYDGNDSSVTGNSSGYTVKDGVFSSNLNGLYVDAVEDSLNSSSISHISPSAFTPMDANHWDFYVGFKTPSNITKTSSILNFATETIHKPLRLSVENGYCNLKVNSIPMLEVHTPYEFVTFSGTDETLDINDTRYYKWITSNPMSPNFHVDLKGNLEIDSDIISGFSYSDYATYPKVFNPSDNWSIQFNIITDYTRSGTIFAFGAVTNMGIRGIDCYLNNNKIVVDISSNPFTIEKTLTSTTTLNPDTAYNVVIGYTVNNNTYSLKINGVTESSEVFNKKIYRNKENVSLIGVNKSTYGNVFPLTCALSMADFKINDGGNIFTGACKSNYLLFEEANVQAASTVYDLEGYEFPIIQIDNIFENSLIDQNLFEVEANTSYYVKAFYEGTKYSVSYSTDNKIFTEVFTLNSTESINHIDQINIGADLDIGIGGYENSYDGILFLDWYDLNLYNYSSEGQLLAEAHFRLYLENITYSEELQDYFHFTPYAYSSFKVNNLGLDEDPYRIQVLENFFRGQKDRIDFNLNEGFSLCLKVDLKDASDKIILAKGSLETDEFNFILKEEATKLVFEFVTLGGDKFSMSKKIEKWEYDSYFNRPIFLMITCNGLASPTFNIYKNGDLIMTGQAPYKAAMEASEAYLTNALDISETAEAVNTINDIIGVKGLLSTENAYYISTLLGTNF